MDIQGQARERIRWMPRGTKHWFATDFDANSDLDEGTIWDYVTASPDWVTGETELTPLGVEVWRILRANPELVSQ